jgi:hypothetical protein
MRFNSLVVWFRRQPVARKLTTMVMTTSGVTLMLACTVFAVSDYINYDNVVKELEDELPARSRGK